MAWCDVVEPRRLRECRIELGQSQAACAAMLGVSPESYRTWDSGRRATPPRILARARALATHRDEQALLPLPVLALLIGTRLNRMLEGKTVGIDATTLEANAAMRSIVRRDTGEDYRAFLTRLAQASGIETPTAKDLARFDRTRKKKTSN